MSKPRISKERAARKDMAQREVRKKLTRLSYTVGSLPATLKTRVIRPGDADWTDSPTRPGDVPRPPRGGMKGRTLASEVVDEVTGAE